MRVGLATIQYGRRDHLEHQAVAVSRMAALERYLVVSMDDCAPPAGAELLSLGSCDPARLPLAFARNRAIEALADCDLVLMLDADCLPHPGLAERLTAAATKLPLARSILAGPVGWLSEPVSAMSLEEACNGRSGFSVKRDFPPSGMTREQRPELFWSLAFAVSPAAHERVGGFDERYAGWGAEDTDYGRRAAAAGVALWKVADAWAYHQPHPPTHRSDAQTASIVANATLFHARWGDWPMPDVLAAMHDAGRIIWRPDGTELTVPTDSPGVSPAQAGD